MKRPHQDEFRRKLGTTPHRRLLLRTDGTLAMSDGSDPAAYLKRWRRYQGMRGSAPVSMLPTDALERLEGDALLARNWPS